MRYEQGNALFLILIAVALFAALSYAVTNSGRGGTGIDREEASIAAAEIVQMAAQIEQAIMRMQIINGCSDTDISFAYDSDSDGDVDSDDDYWNDGSGTECYVFDPNGGGLTYQAASLKWLDGLNSAEDLYGDVFVHSRTCIQNMGSNDVAACHTDGISSNTELILFIPYLSEEICTEIVRQTIGFDSGNVPVDPADAWFSTVKFSGSYGDGARINLNASPNFLSSNAGCFEGSDISGYHFYHVLIAR